MKTYFKSTFNIFTILTLLTMYFGILPVSPAQAESLASPLYASGDFVWAKNMGGAISGAGDAAGFGITLDSSGNIYTTGYFQRTTDFDPGPGTYNLTSAGDHDIFISKLDSNGDFVWARSMGGTSTDYGFSIAVDSSGNVYTTGFFTGTADFDPGLITFTLTGAGFSEDIFVCKLNSRGDFVWAKSMGGTSRDFSYGIALDSNDNVYTTGFFTGTADFNPGVGTSNLTSAGGNDIFVSKLDSSGSFVWAKRMGGANDDASSGLTLDSSGNVYTTGSYFGTVDFDPGAGVSILTSGWNDIFVSKLDSSGGFVWAKSMGGAGLDEGRDIIVDSGGNVYTTGYYVGTADFDPGAGIFNLTSVGDEHDIFVSKLDGNGSFIWAKSMGGTGGMGADSGNGIALDSSGNVYTTGDYFLIADFDPGPDKYNLISANSLGDIFVSKLDSNGNFVWAKSMSGQGPFDVGYDIVLDSIGNIFTTGRFSDTADFDPGPGTYNLTSAGGGDIFVSKLGNVTFTVFLPLILR